MPQSKTVNTKYIIQQLIKYEMLYLTKKIS